MPAVNVRLSDELHAELVAAASAAGRSLQREIIVRLDGRVAAGVSGGWADRDGTAGTPAPAVTSAVRFPGRRAYEPPLCAKAKMHHIYHSGKPCPECGFPAREGAVT